ncbi:MAG: EAL domain-containing protein [Colwellia sp.]
MKIFHGIASQNSDVTGVLTLSQKGVLIDVNEHYLAMTGLKKECLLGKAIDDIDELSAYQMTMDNAHSQFKQFHSTLMNKDGKKMLVNVFLYSRFDDHKKHFTLFITYCDEEDLNRPKTSIMAKIFDNSIEAIAVTDSRGYIQIINQSFSDITGYSFDEVVGKTPAVLSSGRQDKIFYKSFWHKLNTVGYWKGEIWNKRKNGEIFPEWLNISNIKDENNNITHYIAQFTDITQRKKSEEEQHFRIYHDALTNLPNRRLLFEKIKYLSTNKSPNFTTFALLVCDLDRFKLINDAIGHEVGDEILKCVADRLAGKLRDNDIIARSGGDEFIVVIEGEKALRNIDKICSQILSLVEQPFQTKYGEFKTSMSIGVSQFPTDSVDVRELISFANVAMLKLKGAGGNSYALFDTKEKVIITQRLELEKEIESAIDDKNFEVWYQPQINAANNEVYGVECLLRWNHPTRGLISPDIFIPLAEVNGSIKKLGYFVLKAACKQLRQWRNSQLFTGIMAINISLRQFDRNDLVGQVREILAEEMLPGSAIELEVTESLFSEDNDHLIPILSVLRNLGVKIAIDDFGTGYSSLQRLKNLPIDNVKIDKCFVDNIARSRQDAAIIKSIILLSKTFRIDLIAEGVETQNQALKLTKLGCYNHQGYLYSKPLRANEFEQWIVNFNKTQGNNNITLRLDC